MERIYLDRLTKLADHLMYSEELGVDTFDFSTVMDKTACGTAGCALGTLPYLHPNDWKSDGWSVSLKADSRGSAYDDACTWFGINMADADHLFSPRAQRVDKYAVERLGSSATPQQVAQNMYAFIEYKKGEVS